MKIKLTAIILFVCAARLTAQTDVGGNYFTNQTWTLSVSPYTVTGNIAVTAGVTLTIQPGVVIKNTDNYTITVSGLPAGIYKARFVDEVTGYATTTALVKQ